ncbi:MAG: right-handed parallel beta-helix repeat-containing protein, partial [Oscillatoriales cyanobacterium]
QLRGAEVLVADRAGVIGSVASNNTSYTISSIVDDAGVSVTGAVTVDSSGNLTLTSSGEIALNGDVSLLEVTIVAGGNSSKIRIYDSIADALTDTVIGDETDTSVGGGEDTIAVAAGTYDESLTIGTSVKLKGANADLVSTNTTRSSDNEAQITGNITISTSDVTFSGFQLTTGSINASGAGANLVISNNILDNGNIDARLDTDAASVEISGNSIGVNGFGIAVRNATSGKIEKNNIIISGSTTTNDAIRVDSITGMTIADNVLIMPNQGGSGIELGGSATTGGPSTNVTLRNNRITGVSGAGTANQDGGITLRDGNFTGLTISGNQVSGYSAAATTGSLLIVAGTPITATNVSITGNSFADDGTGVSIYSATASGETPTLNVAGNFTDTAKTTALTASNVASAGNTNFLFS